MEASRVKASARGSEPDRGGAAVAAHRAGSGLPRGALIGILAGGLALVAVAVIAVFAVLGRDTIEVEVLGVSMEPTIRSGQRVSATKVEPGRYRPARGDLVVFAAPDGWLARESGQSLIKRVIGLPGERVVCCDAEGRATVDGDPLAERYIKPGAGYADSPFAVVVPEGRLWVMGDNRSASSDSREAYLRSRDLGVATLPVSSVFAVVKP